VGLGPVVLLARMSRPLTVLAGRANGSSQTLSASKSR
jgi:hypothetical protein